MNTFTNKAIIAKAKSESRMVYNGNGQYHVDTFDAKRNAWYQGYVNANHSYALMLLRESYIGNVIDYVFDRKPQCLFSVYVVEDYQDWRTYARIIINTARKHNVGIFSEND